MAGALVHEWIAEHGGSERVFEAMQEVFPKAERYCLWNDRFDESAIESWLASTPFRRSRTAALPLMPIVWRTAWSADPDWILVSTHLFAHHVCFRGAGDPTPKFLYVHTPARYIWEPSIDTRGQNPAARLASPMLKLLDRRRSNEATSIAANSQFVRSRIKDAWQHDSTVIYPPVDTSRIQAGGDWCDRLNLDERRILNSLPAEFVLAASRFIPYKRIEFAISVATRAEVRIVVAGAGPSEPQIREALRGAIPGSCLVSSPSSALLYALYQRAQSYLFPAIEDFGIMPVEAMASGTPVVGIDEGGVGESVSLARGGILVQTNELDSWAAAIEEAGTLDRLGIAERSRIFSTERFKEEIYEFVESGLGASGRC